MLSAGRQDQPVYEYWREQPFNVFVLLARDSAFPLPSQGLESSRRDEAQERKRERKRFLTPFFFWGARLSFTFQESIAIDHGKQRPT